MRIYKNTSILLLITFLLIGCGNNQNSPLSADSRESVSPASTRNVSELNITNFKKEIENLIGKLSNSTNESIDLSQFKSQYNIIKEQTPQPGFLKGLNGSVFEALNKLDILDPKEKNSPNIKSLQTVLGMTGGSVDGQYGLELSTKLSDFLKNIIKALDFTPSPSVSSSPTTSTDRNQDNSVGELKTPDLLTISAILGAFLSVLSLGLNGFLFSQLNQSKATLKELEKKVREHRDDVKKWVGKIDQNIKFLSSQQSEIERKVQQRPQTKGSAYPESAQVYGGREQFGYEETFNSPSTQNPSLYVSQERQFYPRVESTPRAYQAPQSPHEIIAQQFNSNPNAIATSAQGVSETEDSIYRRRRDSSIKQVTLQTISNYSYWIISDAEGGYWLTPIAELKLNPMNFDTFQALFQFSGKFTSKLQLIKPAKVTQASTGQWELIDCGEVQFV